MIVEQIWTANAWRNFNYLVACPESGEALAVDPLDHEKCLAKAQSMGWEITQILNTHEHGDHTGGNAPMVAATGARIIAHTNAQASIPDMDQGLAAGDIVKIGKTIELEVLDTPGHTMSHVCLLSHSDHRAIFCGDTLFNAGAGNCHNGGHPEELYDTFTTQLSKLPDDTRVYPGHDYWENNLAFTLDREPGNQKARDLMNDDGTQDPERALVSTLGLEKEINTFFRLQNPTVISRLKEEFPNLADDPDPQTIFVKLRELRNNW